MLRANLKSISLKAENGPKIILENINFSSEPNTLNIILGRNGTGKSTLIKSLTQLENKNKFSVEGSVFYNDQDLITLNESELHRIRKRNIRYVFQDAVNLFDPLKKLEYYFDLIDSNKTLIDQTLAEFLLPEFEELKKMYVHELSGGMAQRISIVIQLLSKPQLIILDEPTSALDLPLANLIMLKLRQFADQSSNSVLLISQDFDLTKKFADNIFVIENRTLKKTQSIDEAEAIIYKSYQTK